MVNKDQDIYTLIRNAVTEAIHQEQACLTISECARYSKIGEEKIRELVAKKDTDFPYFRVGVKTLINKNLLDKWLEKIASEKRQL